MSGIVKVVYVMGVVHARDALLHQDGARASE